MACDDGLAERIRGVLGTRSDFTERKMFGGLAFLVGGHMTVGIVGEDLMARVGPDAYAAALAEPHCREMDFTGKPMKGLVYVASEGIEDDAHLAAWIDRTLTFIATLPEDLNPSARPRAACEDEARHFPSEARPGQRRAAVMAQRAPWW